MTLDPKTLQFMIFVTSLAMVVALSTVATGHRVAGLWALAGAALSNALTFLFYYLYPRLPDIVGVCISDGSISLTFSLVLTAITQLRGQRLPIGWLVAPPVVTTACSALLLHTSQVRNPLIDAISVVQAVVAIWALLRDGGIGIGRGRHILLASLLVAVLLFAYRSVGVATGIMTLPPMPYHSTGDTVSYLLGYLVVVFSILGFVLAAAEITADEHHQLAMQDALTGLPNRRAVLDLLSQFWSAAIRSERPLTVLMVDVDHFKKINDEHGHAAGDAVLRRLAKLLRFRVRHQDSVGRYGGEEFLVLLPDTGRDGALALAETLRAKIASVPVRAKGKDLPVTVSVGLCSLYPTDADTIPDLLHQADQALYRAKAGGRNCVVGA
jgi:diguanylate cyclase (GGDEF)-like protein